MNNKLYLRILLVLSMINGAVSAVVYLTVSAFMPHFREAYASLPELVPEQMTTMMGRMLELPRMFYAAWGVLYALSFVGCVLMWKLHRSGFHCYALAQLLVLLLPLLFIGKGFFGLGDLMMTALFLLIYYLLLKRVREEEGEAQGEESN